MPRNGNSRRLRQGRFSQAGQIYHIRIATWQRKPFLAHWQAGRCVVRALLSVEPFATTLCYVVMPDHIHWLMQVQADSDLSTIVQRVKSLATKNLRNALVVDDIPVWQPSFFDRALRRDEDIQVVARYIVANPLRAGLANSLREYPLWDAIWL